MNTARSTWRAAERRPRGEVRRVPWMLATGVAAGRRLDVNARPVHPPDRHVCPAGMRGHLLPEVCAAAASPFIRLATETASRAIW